MNGWYENVKWIGDYRFPLEHKGKDCREILNEWMSEYVDKIKNCSVLQKSDIEKIETFSMGLLGCYDLYLDSKFPEAYSNFNCQMNSVKNHLLYTELGMRNYGCNIIDSYYRIRFGEKNYNYKEMLHIPLKSRHNAPTNRFSAPGMPCSYLASEKTLCWYECGMPITFQVAKYDVDLVNTKGKKLLQLDVNPLQTVVLLRSKFCNNDLEKVVKDYIISVCYTLPLIAACSVVVENKGVNFIAEYVLPQMLMVWVKSTTEVAGIRYNSDVKNELARNWHAYNIAVPVRNEGADDGYCRYLTSLFKNDMNENSKTIEIKKYILSNGKQIEALEGFYYKVNLIRQLHKTNDPKQDIIDIDVVGKITDFTQNLLVLLNQVKKEDTNLTYAIVLTVSNLSNWGELIKNSIADVSPMVNDIRKEFSDLVLQLVKELSGKLSYIQDGEDVLWMPTK